MTRLLCLEIVSSLSTNSEVLGRVHFAVSRSTICTFSFPYLMSLSIDVIGVVREASLISNFTIRRGNHGRAVCGTHIAYLTRIGFDVALG